MIKFIDFNRKSIVKIEVVEMEVGKYRKKLFYWFQGNKIQVQKNCKNWSCGKGSKMYRKKSYLLISIEWNSR